MLAYHILTTILSLLSSSVAAAMECRREPDVSTMTSLCRRGRRGVIAKGFIIIGGGAVAADHVWRQKLRAAAEQQPSSVPTRYTPRRPRHATVTSWRQFSPVSLRVQTC